MDIGKKLYQELTPRQRAIAIYAAINGDDQDEVDRLIGNAPRGGSHSVLSLSAGATQQTGQQPENLIDSGGAR